MSINSDIILSIKADVYETTPPESQTTWFPKASSVLVSILFDSTRNLCRIISVVGQTPIINSCIISSSQFIQSSALFGTWYDERVDTTFGVGFANESDLKAFANAFEQAKKKVEEIASPISPRASSNLSSSIENSSAGNVSISADQDENEYTSVSVSNSNNFHQFMSSDWLDVNTGTSGNENIVCKPEDRAMNNNPELNASSASCVQFPILSYLPNFNLNTENEVIVMDINKIIPNEMKAMTHENAYLRKTMKETSKNATDWQLELDSHRKLNDALSKAKEDALRSMEEWKSRSYEYEMEAKTWRGRCEKSENMAQNLAEETIAKYKQQLQDALSGKEFYKSAIQEKEMELRSLKEQLQNKEANPSHTAFVYKKENESLKTSVAKAKQQESISTHLANEQWTTMRDVESQLAQGIQRLIDVHTELKRSVKKGS